MTVQFFDCQIKKSLHARYFERFVVKRKIKRMEETLKKSDSWISYWDSGVL